MLQRIPITYRDMISDAWISANEVADDFCNDRGDRLGYTDRKVTMRRIRPLHNFGNTQLYFVENDARAIDKKATAFSEFNSARGAIQQRSPDGLLHLGDGLGDRRLRQPETVGRLGHAADLCNGLQRMQILEAQASTDTVVPLHEY